MNDLIDRKAAIKAIENLSDCYNGFSDTYDKACIIGALEEVPSAQPEYRLDEWCDTCKEYDQEKHCCPRWNRVIRTTLQDARPERKKGKWKLNKDGNWACPFCDFDPYHDNMKGMNYCPNCGARMEVE